MARVSHPLTREEPRTSAKLTPSARSEAELVARRLHEEFSALVQMLPETERGASAMSRLLSVDRAVCQRMVFTLGRGSPDIRSLIDMPGPSGLRSVIQSLSRRRIADANQLAPAKAAVDRYEEIVKALAGSQRKLRSMLDLESPVVIPNRAGTGLGDPTLQSRKRLFGPAAEIVGRWSETLASVRIVRHSSAPVPLRESVNVRAYLGHVANREAIALESGESSLQSTPGREHGYKTLSQLPAEGETPGILLPDFCSHPLPRVISQQHGTRATHIIDIPEDQLGRPTDIVVAARERREEPHPATWRPPVTEVSLYNMFPSRRLVSDVYLHRDLASKCIASASVHLTTPGRALSSVSRWSTRLQGTPSLQLLGVGLSNTHNAAYPRISELAAHVYEQLGWNPDEFVGYRVEVPFPVWRAAYTVTFDFTGNEIPASG